MKKLHVFLIHGTWAGSARWTHPGSFFRKRLTADLAEIGYEKPAFQTFQWNGRLGVRSRERVVDLLQEEVVNVIPTKDWDWRYLFIAHSHGGNIATDAVRNLLKLYPDLPIEGVVCLNTPFYTHEIRGLNAYLIPWFIIGLLLSTMLWTNPERFMSSPGVCFVPLEILAPVVYSITGALLLFCLISKLFRAGSYTWGPKPNVLCLSCPDDEAITFLGFGEGVSNLPQLFLHPIGLVLAMVVCAFVLHFNGVPTTCGTSECWSQRLCGITEFFAAWVGLAMAGGMLGACAVTVMFGLRIHHLFKTLVSRTLVSYAPLSPANIFFRAIPVKLRLKPVQLFHSSIYFSSDTFDAISAWLNRDKKQNP